jgi:Cof subfamily protein (haloacid dehalogenase superfamily)
VTLYRDDEMKDLSNVMFITDMDGTLLPANKRLNQKDLDAIYAFRRFGGHFSVATGRSLQSARKFFEPLGLDEPVIVCNGGGIYDCDEKKFAWRSYVDTSAYDTVKDILDKFPEAGCEISFEHEIVVVRMSIQEEYHLDISYDKSEFRQDKYENISPEGWCKVLFASSPEKIEEIIKYTEDNPNENVTFVRSSKFFFEILPKDCSKGKALEKLREIYYRKGFIVAASGDFDNDLDMIKLADIGIAPANAQECVKKAACFETKADCDNGAVAEALYYVMSVT